MTARLTRSGSSTSASSTSQPPSRDPPARSAGARMASRVLPHPPGAAASGVSEVDAAGAVVPCPGCGSVHPFLGALHGRELVGSEAATLALHGSSGTPSA